jgi:hypothetical protein
LQALRAGADDWEHQLPLDLLYEELQLQTDDGSDVSVAGDIELEELEEWDA